MENQEPDIEFDKNLDIDKNTLINFMMYFDNLINSCDQLPENNLFTILNQKKGEHMYLKNTSKLFISIINGIFNKKNISKYYSILGLMVGYLCSAKKYCDIRFNIKSNYTKKKISSSLKFLNFTVEIIYNKLNNNPINKNTQEIVYKPLKECYPYVGNLNIKTEKNKAQVNILARGIIGGGNNQMQPSNLNQPNQQASNQMQPSNLPKNNQQASNQMQTSNLPKNNQQ